MHKDLQQDMERQGSSYGDLSVSDEDSLGEISSIQSQDFEIEDSPLFSSDKSTVQNKVKTSAQWQQDSTPSLNPKLKHNSNYQPSDQTVKLKQSPKGTDVNSSSSVLSAGMFPQITQSPRRTRGKSVKSLDYQLCRRAQALFRDGLPAGEIKERLCISHRAMKKMLEQYQTYGRLMPSNCHGNPEQALERQREFLQSEEIIKGLITKNCSITLRHMQAALRQNGISKSRSTIHAYLTRMRISRKKLQKVPLERNSNNKLLYRQTYCKMIQQIPLNKQVFLDQTIFGLQTGGHYGWAPKGEQPKVFFPASRRKHITLLAAVSIRGFEATKIIKGPVTSKHVCEFLQHYLDHLQPDEILILDNARMHHAAVVKAKIKELNRPVRYIPAYTPQLNPIENIFSEIKGQYARLKEEKQVKGEDMVRMIEQAIRSMRSKEFGKYYEHYEQWLKKGVAGELFI